MTEYKIIVRVKNSYGDDWERILTDQMNALAKEDIAWKFLAMGNSDNTIVVIMARDKIKLKPEKER